MTAKTADRPDCGPGATEARAFEHALAMVPTGYSEGRYLNRRYGTTVRRSADGRRVSLFAEELAGNDIISFNLYRLDLNRFALKPCEMSSEKVVDFVLGYSGTQSKL